MNKWRRAVREGRVLRDERGRVLRPEVVRTGVSLMKGDGDVAGTLWYERNMHLYPDVHGVR